jgi:hypothetical protein
MIACTEAVLFLVENSEISLPQNTLQMSHGETMYVSQSDQPIRYECDNQLVLRGLFGQSEGERIPEISANRIAVPTLQRRIRLS